MLLPLGKLQSSYRGRCTSAVSMPSARARHNTAPAAWISPVTASAISGPGAPGGDELLLQVAERVPVGVQVVPGPGAVAVQPPPPRALVHGQVDERVQFGLLCRVL